MTECSFFGELSL